MIAARPQAPYFIEHEAGKGVVARYHLDTAEIESQLAALRAAGADGISLSLWLMQSAGSLGAGDEYLEWSGGALIPQMQANLVNLLKSIKTHGFNWVQIAVEFYGPNDPRENPWPSGDLSQAPPYYAENWAFLSALPALCDAAGLPYLIDVGPEFNDKWESDPALNGQPNVGLQLYTKRTWIDTTCTFAPNGVPCWNFSMSFIPGNYDVLAQAFQGNPPEILLPHIYRGEQQQVYDALSTAGLAGHPWIFGECFSLTQPSDSSVAADVASFVVATKQPIMRVCPWPVDPRTPQGTSIAVIPQVFSQPWKDAGF